MRKLKLRRIISIVIAALLAIYVIGGFIATALIYDRVFARYDNTVEIPREVEESRVRYTFASGENELVGYLYGSSDRLIVLAQGFRAVQEEYLPVVLSLTAKGYSVFTFDPTGVGQSGGSDQRGFPQQIADLEACLDFIDENDRFGCSRLYLFGHSRGGTAACVLAARADIVVAAGAYASVMDGVLQPPYGYVGRAAYLNYPHLWLWQTIRFGTELTGANAVSGLKACHDTDILIIQGLKDESAPRDRFSLYSHRGDIGPNGSVQTNKVDYGHVDMLYSDGEANEEVIGIIVDFIEFSENLPII